MAKTHKCEHCGKRKRIVFIYTMPKDGADVKVQHRASCYAKLWPSRGPYG